MGNLKRQFAKAAAIGVADAAANTIATTVWLHRGLTHEAYKPGPAVSLPSRFILWTSGVIPREWAAVHVQHHEKADVSGDPHSPVEEQKRGRNGVLSIILRNPFKYRDEVKRQRELSQPERLQPDTLDKKVFDSVKTGLAVGIGLHVEANRRVGNPGYMGLVSFAIGKVLYVAAGSGVNALGHGGKDPINALVTGKIEPHEDGTYGADNPVLGMATLGEGWQKFHHDHPGSLMFNDLENPVAHHVCDIGGSIAKATIALGLSEPASEPPQAA